MQEPYICERCKTPFVRGRVTQRGCSPTCRRWLYEHQDQITGLRPWETPSDASSLKEKHRLAMRRYRARKRAGLVAEQIPDPKKKEKYLALVEKLSEPEQRVCPICTTYFTFDPNSGLLPGCSKACRVLIYKHQVTK
jgi:hypothetical protein